MAENPNKLLKEAERLYQRGEKRKGAELIERVLMQNFNDASAWAMLHRQYGNGKPFHIFQHEFTQTYYPDKLVLLDDEARAESDNGNSSKRGILGRIFGGSNAEPAPAAQDHQSAARAGDGASITTDRLQFSSAAPFVSQPAARLDSMSRPKEPAAPLPHEPQKSNGAYTASASSNSDVIKVMVVDDITMTRENIIRSLAFEKKIEVIGSAENGHQAIDLVGKLLPDVILMDINMPGMDGISATREVTQLVPFVQVIILTVQDDPDYLRKAMMAGARDFLSKPPTIDELIGAVLRAGEIAQRGRAKMPSGAPAHKHAGSAAVPTASGRSGGKVITVYSPKGGAGCTMIAANLAACLHNDDTRVALVDGSLQFGDLLAMYNEQSKNSVVDLAPRSAELDVDIVNEVMVSHKSGVRILGAPKPEDAEQVTGEHFAALLDFLRSMFHYIIVDTPSRLSDVTIAALDSSDIIMLLTTQDIPAIASVRKFLDLVPLLKLDRRRIITVMNQYNPRMKIDPAKVGQTLQNDIVATVPLEPRVVIPSINRGLPFMLQNDGHSSDIGKSIRTLTESIRTLTVELSHAPAAAHAAR